MVKFFAYVFQRVDDLKKENAALKEVNSELLKEVTMLKNWINDVQSSQCIHVAGSIVVQNGSVYNECRTCGELMTPVNRKDPNPDICQHELGGIIELKNRYYRACKKCGEVLTRVNRYKDQGK